jgi:hypothetical protein
MNYVVDKRCYRPQDYKSSGAGVYSSASNYQDMESILDVETLSQRLETVK